MPEGIKDGTVFSKVEIEEDGRVILCEDEKHGNSQFTDATILIFIES